MVKIVANLIAGRASCHGDRPDAIITDTSLSAIVLLYTKITAINVTNGIIIEIIKGIKNATRPIKLPKFIP